jgi:hypothetical protein
MKPGVLCVVYVDDTIFAGADPTVLETEIAALGVNDSTPRHQFQLRNEGEVGAFLGIQIKKTGLNEFYLSQPGLIEKVLLVSGMDDCNGVDTPTSTRGGALGADLDGDPFMETWNYRTVIGMLMFISANTRPDLAFAVHQAARFSHSPRNSHAIAVKRILRYLQRTRDKGFSLRPSSSHQVDCYVDADFAGNFGTEHPSNPDSVKSRTGFSFFTEDVRSSGCLNFNLLLHSRPWKPNMLLFLSRCVILFPFENFSRNSWLWYSMSPTQSNIAHTPKRSMM